MLDLFKTRNFRSRGVNYRKDIHFILGAFVVGCLLVTPDLQLTQVPVSSAASVTQIDPGKIGPPLQEVGSIPVGISPYAAIMNPVNGLIYVINSGSPFVSVIDPQTNSVIKNIFHCHHPAVLKSGRFSM